MALSTHTGDFGQIKRRPFLAHSWTKWDREKPLGQRNSHELFEMGNMYTTGIASLKLVILMLIYNIKKMSM